MSKSAARHSGKNATIICLAPDVCLTPVGSAIVPIPYMIVSQLSWSDKTIATVSLTGLEAFTMKSRTNKVTGDEAGIKGGVVSGVNRGWCRPKSNKSSVFVGGTQLIENDCIYEMNCAGSDGASNTVGKLVYFE
jgi:hypothetical protein